MYLDSWICSAFSSIPSSFKEVLDWVAKVNKYKLHERPNFKKNDFGFEQIIVVYLTRYFINKIRENGLDLQLGVSEKLREVGVKYDFSLFAGQNNSIQIKEVVEVKTITNNNFSWLKGDVEKLRQSSVENKYLLAVSLYVPKLSLESVLNRKDEKIDSFTSSLGVNHLQSGEFHTSGSYAFWYFLFKVD
ncbi:hypothetical protein [Desulfurobacterium crinifex]